MYDDDYIEPSTSDDFYSDNMTDRYFGRAPSTPCPACHGTGGEYVRCHQCQGHGTVSA
jgi:DnaJ-class molecular chaperone